MGVLFGRRPPTAADVRAGRIAQARQGPMWGITSAADLIPIRPFQRLGAPSVTHDTALRHSAVWACLRLRADLISTLPLDVFRRVAGIQVQCPRPQVLINPEGYDRNQGHAGWAEWCYSSQFDLDRAGNAIGLITARDGLNFPSRVELAPAPSTQVLVRGGRLWKYRIDGTLYDPADVWHERAYTLPGLHVGLSPVAYAAWAIGEYLSVQEFATNWFTGGAVPKARLRNVAKTVAPKEATIVKESWRAAVAADEPFVHGNDWEYDLMQAQEASQDWIEAKKFSITDIARFFGCPADLIDSAATGASGHITYANVNQRHMQLLILNLGPAIIRRELAWSAGLVPQPRYVKLNTDALLRLDPADRATFFQSRINARTMTPDEARELENQPPLTDAQYAQFDRLFGVPANGNIWAPPKPKPGQPAAPPPPEPAAIEGDGQDAIEPPPEPAAIEGPKG